jgi:hypothetical protein
MFFLMVWILKKTGSVTRRVPAFDELEFMSDLGSRADIRVGAFYRPHLKVQGRRTDVNLTFQAQNRASVASSKVVPDGVH